MKYFISLLIAVNLTACNTVSGTLQGAGKDISSVGKWMEPKPEVQLYPQDNRTSQVQERR
jgi:hypothetical protein